MDSSQAKEGFMLEVATTTEVKEKDHFLRINMKMGPGFDLEVGRQAITKEELP